MHERTLLPLIYFIGMTAMILVFSGLGRAPFTFISNVTKPPGPNGMRNRLIYVSASRRHQTDTN